MKTKPDVPADIVYDPYDRSINLDPYTVWKRMRREAPLYYNEEYDFYALSRYDDVYDAIQNWRDYSSARGTVLEFMQLDDAGGKVDFGGDNLGMMIFSDPPVHDVTRRLVNQHFSPKSVMQFENRARQLCREFFEQVEGESEFDVVDSIIRPIPPMMIGEIIGVPEEDQAYLGRLVDESLTYDPESGPDVIENGVRQGKDSHRLIAGYLADLVKERMTSPRDDLLSLLTRAELKFDDSPARTLETQELISFFMLLQGAGSETTARALGWATVLLARYPEQREKLVTDPGKIRNAVEEILRYEPPSPIQARYVTSDVEWYGVTVPRGSRMALLNGSAGRDEHRYEDPDAFDVERKQPRHVTFGYGTHVCLGASLARLEMRVVLEELLKRFPAWQVDESRVKMASTTTVRGPTSVPIVVN